MDNSFRLQLLRTKRELQLTINQIDNILFYNPQILTQPSNTPNRTQSSRQFVEGLMNILSSRRNAPANTSSNVANSYANTSSNVANSYANTSSNVANSYANTSSNVANSYANTSSNVANTSSNFSRTNIPTSTGNIYNNIFDNYQAMPLNNHNVLPDLVEVTLYSPNTNTSSFSENVNVTPNINVLSNSSSIHIYRSLDTEFEQCTICMENFNEHSIVRKINNCRHIFHINCIDTWFETNITCPICRTDLRDINSNEDEEI
jgi:hypothetical protein